MRHHRSIVRAALLGLSLAACSGASAPTPEPTPNERAPTPEPPPATDEPATDEPTAPPIPVEPTASTTPIPELDEPQRLAVGRAVNGLAADLFAPIARAQGNVTFSPASIEAALAMTAAGARGATRDEMVRVLHLEGDSDAAIDALGATLRRWDDPARTTYTLRVANRLFGERTFTFEEAYLTRVRDVYAAPLEPLDFRGAADGSRVHINGWVAQHTRDRIRDLLPPRSIDADTRLVLVNAVYLDARWLVPFERTATRDAPFTTSAGESVSVPTMNRRGSFAVGTVGGATVVELPYQGGDLAMRFVLPAQGSAPEAWATAANLSDVAPLTMREIRLALPRFRIEPADPVALRQYLEPLGMRAAFQRGAADFTGIAAPPSPDDRLYITEGFHKAFVRVDEEGTEAAAATAIVMGRVGSAMPQPVEEIRFDRPFLFVLRDVHTGATLFVGRVSDPR